MFPRLLLVLACFGSLLASAATPLDSLVRTMADSGDPALQLNVLRGINAALKGKRNLPAPAGWDALYEKLRQSPEEPLRQQAQVLSAIFGGAAAFEEMRGTLTSAAAKPEARLAALEALAIAQDPASLPLFLGLLKEAGPLRRPALRGLALYDDRQVTGAVLAVYSSLNGEEKRDALAALARRPSSARALVAAVDGGQVPRADLTAPFARQLQDLNDATVSAWLKEHWGAIHTSSADKLATIAKLKAFLTPEVRAQADLNHGRAIFSQTCAICHTLFGAGAKIGPELPGAFEDVDYLLQNVVDPNAIIGKDYQQNVVQMKQGETVIGIIGAQDGSTITLKTLGGPVVIQRGDIAQLTVLEVSLMPEGLLSAMAETDVRDLFGYLRQHGQVPALLNEANLNDFNDDANFDRWSRSGSEVWEVKDGVLTGRGSPDRAEFLTSDFVADRYRLELDLLLTGAGSTAEVVLPRRDAFTLTQQEGAPSRLQMRFQPGRWIHLQIVEKGSGIEVRSKYITPEGGLIEAGLQSSDPAGDKRQPFAFRISGPGELKVRNLRLSLPDPKAD